MREKLRKVYFGFTVNDREAARQWLEEQAADGWELVKFKRGYFIWAYFRPLEGASPRYCADIADYTLKDMARQREYDQLADDAGWELVDSVSGMKIYRSMPGRDPIPLQTDPELEKRRYWRQVRLPGLVGTAILLALLLIIYLGLNLDGPLLLYCFFFANGSLLFLCLLFAHLGWYVFRLVSWPLRRRERRAKELAGGPTDPHRARRRLLGSQVAALLGSILSSAIILLNLPMQLRVGFSEDDLARSPALYAEDLGLSGSSAWGWDRADSLLLRGIYVRQSLGDQGSGGRLDQERYTCRFPWVASLVLDGLLKSEVDGTHFSEGTAHIPGALVPAELGFDEAYTAQYGSYHCLILRQGNVVVLLEGPVDFTSAETLPLLWDTLELEV